MHICDFLCYLFFRHLQWWASLKKYLSLLCILLSVLKCVSIPKGLPLKSMDSSHSCSVSGELFVLDCVCQESFISGWELIYKLIYGMFLWTSIQGHTDRIQVAELYVCTLINKWNECCFSFSIDKIHNKSTDSNYVKVKCLIFFFFCLGLLLSFLLSSFSLNCHGPCVSTIFLSPLCSLPLSLFMCCSYCSVCGCAYLPYKGGILLGSPPSPGRTCINQAPVDQLFAT